METTEHGWGVIDRDATVLTNCYVFDGRSSTANSFVAPMADGKLMVMSPIFKASDGLHSDLATFGEVGAVVANNGFHHLGQPEWRARYPDARFFAPAEAFARIKKKNPAAPAFEPLSALPALLGPDVHIGEATNTKCGECWAWAKIDGGYAWFVSDLLANMPALPKKFPVRQLFKWTKSAPGFRPFNLAMKFTVKDKRAVLRALAKDMAAHPPTVIVPSHGPPLTRPGLAEETQALITATVG